METQLNNVDVLVLGNNPVAKSIMRVLEKYPDLTLFMENNIGPILPDLIVLTDHDPYKAVSVINQLPKKYKDIKKVYIAQYISTIPVGLMLRASVLNIITTDVTGKELHEAFLEVGRTPAQDISNKFMLNFISKYYGFLLANGLSLSEAVALGAKVRGYPYKSLLGLSTRRFNTLCFSAQQKLGLSTKQLYSVDSIVKYGCVYPGPRYKKYIIPSYRRHAKGYFLLPQVYESDGEK